MGEFQEIIFKRRSIRKFTDEPVSEADLTLLLEAAMAAPTAMNAQPWEFVVITDPQVVQKLRNVSFFGKYNNPAVIVVCGSMRVTRIKSADRFWVQDCSAATENILLAATAMGLGTVWIGIYPIFSYVKRISQILNLPEEVTPLNLIYIGHPAEEKEARTQYDAKKVHWQIYEERKSPGNRKSPPKTITASKKSRNPLKRQDETVLEEKEE